MINRRELVVGLGACAGLAPFRIFAQQRSGKVYRLGFLGPTSAADIVSRLEALRFGLRELGYVEAKNLVTEFRWAEGKYERLAALAAELVHLKVDVIVTHATPASRAAKQATTTIPIVIATIGDAVASGLVASLPRPGGNITGLSFFGPEIAAKRLELLKEAVPGIRRVAVLFNPDSIGAKPEIRALEATAGALKMGLQQFTTRNPSEFEHAFAAMSKQRVEAVTINEEPMLVANAVVLANLAAKHRIPLVGFLEIAEAGGLMAYAASFPAMWHRAAYFVDRILKGTKPGDLPVERPTRFELTINLQSAKALGIAFPHSIMLQATRVID